MKKFLLSAFVIGVFVLYSVYSKQNTDAANLAIVNPTATTAPVVQATSVPGSSPAPTAPPPTDTPVVNKGMYKDGQYTSTPVDYFYGTLQLKAIVSQGKLTNIQFLQFAQDRQTSMMISQMSLPQLRQEAIVAQNANVDMVSGATDTSQAFIQSLTEVLNQAKS